MNKEDKDIGVVDKISLKKREGVIIIDDPCTLSHPLSEVDKAKLQKWYDKNFKGRYGQ